MFKKISVFFVAVMLAGCSSISDITSYIPFMGKDKKVIDLDKDKIDQKSYAAAYAVSYTHLESDQRIRCKSKPS